MTAILPSKHGLIKQDWRQNLLKKSPYSPVPCSRRTFTKPDIISSEISNAYECSTYRY
jgi:hypothetical protein